MKGILKYYFIIMAVCFVTSVSYSNDDVIIRQTPAYKELTSVSKFSKLHADNTQFSNEKIENIHLFKELINNACSKNNDLAIENIEKLVRVSDIAFERSGNNISFLSKKAYSILSFTGKHLDKLSSKRVKDRPFYKHISDAITINKARRVFYSKMSDSRSENVSDLLIAFEYSIIPVAIIVDKLALKYQKDGIPIIQNDFVDMANIPCASRTIKLSGHLTASVRAAYIALMAEYKKSILKLSRQRKFIDIQQLSNRCLSKIIELETTSGCYFAMGKHVVESLEFSARNAIKYQEASKGKTNALASSNMLLQALGINVFAELDILSSPMHKIGVGILVNDLPAILPHN